MVVAYLIILVGGSLITARLHLLGMSLVFWVTLAAGIGILAASGHCMTARWAFAPVCGSRFWWAIVASPEVLIFLFFMITDPKTVPAGRVARLVFAVCVALASTLLIAPQRTEFGAKVGLLAGLVILCAARLPFERFFPAARTDRDRLGGFVARLSTVGDVNANPRRSFARGAIGGAAAVVLVSGSSQLGCRHAGRLRWPAPTRCRRDVAEIDRSALPSVTVDAEVADLSSDLAGSGGQEVAVNLAENLATESQALLAGTRTCFRRSISPTD